MKALETQWEEMLDEVADVQRSIIQEGRTPEPAAHFLRRDGGIEHHILIVDSDKSKARAQDYVCRHAREIGAKAVVVVFDCWLSVHDGERATYPYKRPSRDPNRKEAIVAVLHTPDGSWVRWWPYKRIRHENHTQIVWEESALNLDTPGASMHSQWNPWRHSQ